MAVASEVFEFFPSCEETSPVIPARAWDQLERRGGHLVRLARVQIGSLQAEADAAKARGDADACRDLARQIERTFASVEYLTSRGVDAR